MSYSYLILITIFLIFLLLFIASTPKDSYFDRLGLHIGSASGIYIVIGVFITYKFLEYNYHELTTENTLKTVDRAWLNILNIFEQYKDKCPNLINSLFYDFQKENFTFNLDLNKKDDWFASVIVSNNIFQTWEDVLTLAIADETGLYVWIAIFLQYTRSNLLLNMWNRFKPNYSLTTQQLGDLLFSYTPENKPSNQSELSTLANKIFDSIQFKKIISDRNNL
jgi:hypothetical protein